MSTLGRLCHVVMVWARVHVCVGDTKVLPHIGAYPVGWVLMVHRGNVCFVLARAWHVEVLGPGVKLHTEGELGLLLAWCVGVVRVARIWEVEVAWDIVLRAWHTHELHLVAFLPLHVSDFGGEVSAIVDSGALTAFGCHTEGCRARYVSYMLWVVRSRTQISRGFSRITFLLILFLFVEGSSE